MKKLIILAIVCFIAGNAFATMSRINGMGVATWMLEDDTNIWLSPAQVNEYPDLLIGDLGAYPAAALPTVSPTFVFPGGACAIANQWGGATRSAKIKYPTVIGLFLARPYTNLLAAVGTNAAGSDINGGGSAIAVPVGLAVLAPTNKYDIFYGIKLGDKTKLAVQVNSAGNSNLTDNVVTTLTSPVGDVTTITNRLSSEMNIGVGLLLKDFIVFNKADLSVNMNQSTVNNRLYTKTGVTAGPPETFNYTDQELKTKGTQNISYAVRGIKDLSKTSKLFVFLQMNNSALDNTYTDKRDTELAPDALLNVNGTEERTYKFSGMQAGGALNIMSSEKTMLILGLSMVSNTTEITETETGLSAGQGTAIWTLATYNQKVLVTRVPLNIAIEHRIKKVTTRLGISQMLMEATKTTTNDPNYALGVLNTTTSNTNTVDPQTATTICLGLGAAVAENISLDVVVQQDVMFTGGYLLSGIANTMAAQTTLVYKF